MGAGLLSFEDIAKGLSNLEVGAALLDEKSLIGYGLTFVAVVSWGSSTVLGKKLS